jgi:ribosomal protein S18 acetylase RimI-like enzyme
LGEEEAACEYLEWDSRFFGVRVGRLQASVLTGEIVGHAEGWCAAHHIDCLYVLTDDGGRDERRLAEQCGLRPVDVRLSLRKSPLASLAAEPDDPRVRAATDEDIPRLREIAARSHRRTRFYADPHFPHGRADAMYAHWIERSVRSAADCVLVGEQAGTVVGYTSGTLEKEQGRVALVAVDEAYRRGGLGRALTTGVLKWFSARGVDSASVVTQGGGTPAVRLYEQLGFVPVRRQQWYHWWFHQDR